MNETQNLIATILKKYNWTLGRLAREIGKPEWTVGQWSRGKHEPRRDAVDLLKNVLLAGPDPALREPPAAYIVPESDIVRLPVYGDVPAGTPDNWAPQEAIDFYPVPRRALKGNPKNGFVLTIRGNSMTPDLHEGDMVVVNPNLTPMKGEKVVARVDGGFTVKLWTGDPKRLAPLNKDHKEVCCIEEGQLVGVVVIEMKVSRVRKLP